MIRYAVLVWRALNSRAVKVLLYLWVLVWGLDRAFFWATEAAWFGSVGQSEWFTTRFLAQFGLFWGAFFAALISAALIMRIAARPAPGAELRVLPAALERLEPLRRGATKLAWIVLIVGAWIVARQMAGGWALVLGARAGDLADPIWRLPLARLALNCVWEWSLFLLGALAFAGGLRALPLLAARQQVIPLRLWRALTALGILVLTTRAALYALAIAEANASDGATGAELFVGLPLRVLGIGLCFLAAFWCVRKPGYKKLGIAVALAAFGPHLLGLLLAPLGLVLPAPAGVVARNRAQTLTAWGLDSSVGIAKVAPPLASHWPIWNEEALLGLARGEYARNGAQVIDWKNATIVGSQAIVAGVPAGLENWGSPHDADAQNGIDWLAFDATRSAEGLAPALPDAALPLMSFYGISGRPLLGDATSKGGVPFQFWGWKFAWAWRLRDPLLMLEGARAQRLLVYRGARESAQRLAPFLTWDEPQLKMTRGGPRWELVGYASTSYARGALAAGEGAFANHNGAASALLMRLDPRDGRAELFGLMGAQWSAPWAKVVGATLSLSLAPITAAATTDETAASGETAPATPMLDAARALVARRLGRTDVLAEPVWTWSGGRAQKVLFAPNLPGGVDERLAVLDAAARRDWTREDDAKLQIGEAAAWPAARAPGGFWIARPYYAATTTPGVASVGGIARDAKLWRVSLTAIAESPIAHGDDTRAALVAFDLQTAPPVVAPPIVTAPLAPNPKGTPSPNAKPNATPNVRPGVTTAPIPAPKNATSLEALRAHDAAQEAAKRGEWGEWEKQSARERKLLEELAGR